MDISDEIINHLGRNPVSGGRPPKDRSNKIKLKGISFVDVINFRNWLWREIDRR